MIIFNQGNTPERAKALSSAPWGIGSWITIPVVGASFADGVSLAQAGSTALVDVDPPESGPQVNVIAELAGDNEDNVVMAGAHLDSVQADQGSRTTGAAPLFSSRSPRQIAKLKPENTFDLPGGEPRRLV